MKTPLLWCFVCVLASAVAAPPPPDGVKTLEIGASAPDFDLLGVDGKQHALAQYADAEVLAVLFTCNHCPTAQAVEERVKALVENYRDQSFQLVAISPNDASSVRVDELGYSVFGDSYEEMRAHAKLYGFNFPYLYDGETQATSMAFGAMATPQIFIFDRERKLRYQGRIDDSKYETGATQHDARNAIDALLAGKPVPVETTRAFGCSTKWAYKKDSVGKTEAAWQARVVTVEGIDDEGVRKLVANGTEKLRLINVWATWCGPCVAEFPDLVSLGRQFENRGFDLITISVDEPTQEAKVLQFLESEHAAMGKRTELSVQKEGRTTNNYLFSQDLDRLAEALDPAWQGGLPYTVLVNSEGKIVWRHQGELSLIEARKQILGQIGRFYEKP